MDEKLLYPKDLGEIVGKSTQSLAQWRYLGYGPKFVKIGRQVRYRQSDVNDWLDQQTRDCTGTPALY